jgi:hemerythrin superfamily protein
MNAIDLLLQDHRKVERLFSEFLTTESDDVREELFEQIQTELLAHGEAEELAFYPALRSAAPEQVEEAIEEHAEMQEMLAELSDVEFEDVDFDERFMELMRTVQDHVAEEESPGGLMEVAWETLDSKTLSKLASDIQAIKRGVEGEMAA